MITLETAAQNQAGPSAAGVRTIVLPQRFDVHEIARFESSILQMVSAGAVLAIDASEVRHMDRSAIDCLISARLRCMDNGGDLTLVATSVAARVILELSGRYEALSPADEASFDEIAA